MSIARRAFPSRLELKSLAGSFNEAPFMKVSFTIDLYDSPEQMMPSCDQTGVPGMVCFAHFHSSTTSGSACLMSSRIMPRVCPRQSPSSAIRSSINSDADRPSVESDPSMWFLLLDIAGACASARRHLGELRRVVADLVPARLVGHLLVEAGAKVELRHQAGGHEVDGAEVVVEAGSAVAAEVPRGQLALVGLHQVLALGEPEVFLRHHHARQAGAGPVLTTRAMAVAQ